MSYIDDLFRRYNLISLTNLLFLTESGVKKEKELSKTQFYLPYSREKPYYYKNDESFNALAGSTCWKAQSWNNFWYCRAGLIFLIRQAGKENSRIAILSKDVIEEFKFESEICLHWFNALSNDQNQIFGLIACFPLFRPNAGTDIVCGMLREKIFYKIFTLISAFLKLHNRLSERRQNSFYGSIF